ncbi:MAG: hypothetical protein LBD23_07045 [Oscillospiraceae bacterium]|jgi:hypothetical protein|nr:hypothetical protein [Oscillospiraceae bacterium]
MIKKVFLWIVLDLIFLVIFNTFFFLLGGTEHNISVWISYGFIHFAYLMLLLTPALISKGKSGAVFGFAIYAVSSPYFILAFVVGVIFVLIAPESYTAALLVQLSIAGLYGIALIANLLANEHTANKEESRQQQIDYVKNASIKLKALLERVSDKEAKKKIEKVYDVLYSSPVKSHEDLAHIESRILQSIYELENEINSGNKENIVSSANSLLSAVNERNMRLKTLN